MPSGPGALWGHTLVRADAISSIVIEEDEGFSAGYWKSGMSERLAGGIGGKNQAFRALHWASSVAAGPYGR